MMSDYKHTLHLPKTDFPMKANLAIREVEWLTYWEEIKLYQTIRQQRQGAKKFILYDGPPYANGDIHIGHALNKILKDMVIKSKLLSGFDVPVTPNWDCHGLPIELNIEKSRASAQLTPQQFRQACRDYALTQVASQKQAFIRLGVLMDWSHPILTMDFLYEANIIRSLQKILERGCLHQGYKPVYWCIDCRSALAEAEVEYQQKKSLAIDVCFVCVDSQDLFARCQSLHEITAPLPCAIAVWTTTPWTLPANQAVAVNPDLIYVLLQYTSAERAQCVLVAESLVDDFTRRCQLTDYQIIARCQGRALEHLLLHHPFYERTMPIILGDHVQSDSGTGAVHTAPAHGVEDYVVGQLYQLPIDNPVDARGVFHPDVPLVGGQHVHQAHTLIVELLKQRDNLLHEAVIEHSYPHCWRHKIPLIFRATPQWFIGMEPQQLRARALHAINSVTWVPSWGQARIESMIASRPDWCISRQRQWCVPMCLILHKKTQQLHPRMAELMRVIADHVAQRGLEAWHELSLVDLIGDEAADYEKSADGLDVWFDSGVMHECLTQQDQAVLFPADLCLEGSDQHRGWFNSLLLTAVAIRDQAPYKTVLTHGFTVDAAGRKMSKSLGNVISPDHVVKTLGADILRLWVAATDYTGEIAVSDDILKRTSDSYRRLRNTARFLLANLAGFDPAQHCLDAQQLLALDRWILDRAWQLQQEIIEAYDQYQFHQVYQKIHHFCVVDLGSFYLDIIKDRQYTMPQYSVARLSAQTAMYHMIEALVRWLAPITTFTAEEIWRFMPGQREQSVHLTQWYPHLIPLAETSRMNRHFWTHIQQVRNAVNKVLETMKMRGVVNSALEAHIILYAALPLKTVLDLLGEELRFVLIASETSVKDLDLKSAAASATELEELWVEIIASSSPKCERCWQRRADVGHTMQHPGLCSRCVANVAGQGEDRRYA